MKPIVKMTDSGAELWLTGYIVQNEDKELYGWYGLDAVCPGDITDALQSLNGRPVTVRVDGYGGSMFAASTIYTEFMEYPGSVTFKITGLAASAMSTVSMASAKEGNRCLMSPMAFMMIHNAQGGTHGDYREHEHEADRLKTANQTAINAYAMKTGLPEKEIQQLMDAETWLDAQTALDKRFIDGILFTEDCPEESRPDRAVVNVMSRNLKTICNSIPAPSRQALEALRASFKPPDDDSELYELAQAELNIEQLRFGGKTE